MLQIISTSEYKLQLSARRAYYGLQSSGVCFDGVTPKTHKHRVGIQPILLLTYGCSAVNIDHKSVKGMPIKTALGLPKHPRNSSHLAALGIEKIERLIKRQQLSLLRNSLISNSNFSKARTFFSGMMRTYYTGYRDVSLLSRCNCIFWRSIWQNMNSPRSGIVADIMRRTRANYHYAIRRLKKQSDQLSKNAMAQSIANNNYRTQNSEIYST